MTAAYTQLTLAMTRDGDSRVVTVNGDLDHDNAPDLRLQLEQAADDGVERVELDLTGVTFIDSAALQVFVSVSAALGERGGSLLITAASPLVTRILAVTGLDDLFRP